MEKAEAAKMSKAARRNQRYRANGAKECDDLLGMIQDVSVRVGRIEALLFRCGINEFKQMDKYIADVCSSATSMHATSTCMSTQPDPDVSPLRNGGQYTYSVYELLRYRTVASESNIDEDHAQTEQCVPFTACDVVDMTFTDGNNSWVTSTDSKVCSVTELNLPLDLLPVGADECEGALVLEDESIRLPNDCTSETAAARNVEWERIEEVANGVKLAISQVEILIQELPHELSAAPRQTLESLQTAWSNFMQEPPANRTEMECTTIMGMVMTALREISTIAKSERGEGSDQQ